MCGGTFAHFNSWETPLRVQKEQGPSEVIEIWESQREPSLVRSRVAKCASTFLIRLVMVKWESVLVTLGNRHHLDGLVVIGSLVIIRRACGWPNSSCERLWVIHRDGVSKNQPIESTWSLRGSRGSYTLCVGAPMRTSGEWRLSDTSAKHHRVPLSIYFEHLF